ncbi:bifunctional GNAT family N-acetyltransferase/carbon-nitrogen hydrolase family protein [Thalassoroseus pseudoceratinae]|uniref:bifunctional GNAT family N-acetyltransferase/carbon-nitrogen hydrolase family protein n=1 Tax=Thalassoroseus pseudoceratinae TaxID=2713176 RepID=UPI00141FF474|nr:bifunctional GNAT family N-acetyltransferase/carbon-nitrogen hydrolase family protein [Thalassoroseus pseudoceratinae]
MEPVDLSDYAWDVRIRPMTIDDFDELIAMQARCFPDMSLWKRDQIESQLSIFPEGQLVIEIDGKLAASASSLIVNYEPNLAWHDWKKIADGGYIRNHEPDGDTLYGIEIMVDPEYRGMKLSRRLYDARKELCVKKNLDRFIVAGRIPGYSKYADRMSAREYVERVMNKELHDPVLTAQQANQFAVQGLIPNYFPDDAASLGYATFLEWRNLDRTPPEGRRRHRAVHSVRLAAVQYHMRAIKGFDDFAQQCEYFVDAASDYHCDFAVFPELFTTQLLSCVKATRPGLAARQLADFTPRYLEFFTECAVKYNVNLIGGSQFVIEDEQLYNVAFFFGRDGSIEKQYKLHITPSERKWWGVTPGDRVNVFDTDCGRVAMLVCYDIEFPELVRIAASKGAQIIFVPFNTDTVKGYLRVRLCAQARCIENHVYVVIAGCTGNLPFVENADIHYAQSGIFTPADVGFPRDGVGAECNPNVETFVMDDVDLEVLRRHKTSGSVQNWNDRLTSLYRVVYNEDGEQHEV